MPRSHRMQNCSLKWSWWILNEEFPVLLGIHFCQIELPAGVVTPGSGHSGACLEMSAECCPCPSAVQRQPPLNRVCTCQCLPSLCLCSPCPSAGALQGPTAARAPSLLCCPVPHGIPTPFDSSSARRDPGPVNTSRAELRHSVLPPGSNEAVQESSERY